MNIFQDVTKNTHSLKESDFKPEEIYRLKGDKIHPTEIQVYMTVAIRDGKMYVLSSEFEKLNSR